MRDPGASAVSVIGGLVALPAQLADLLREVRQVRAILSEIRAANPPALVDVSQAARLLGCSAATIRRDIARGRLTAVRIGRRVRVDLAQVTPADHVDVTDLAHRARESAGRRRG